MGRHSNGKQNYRIARGPLLVLLALIIVMALVLGWWQLRSDTAANRADDTACAAGDMTLPISVDPALEQQVRELVTKYKESNPVVQDHCVKPQVTTQASATTLETLTGDDSGATNSAVWVPAGAAFAADAQAGGVAMDTKTPNAGEVPVGFAIAPDREAELKDKSWSDLGKLKIAAAGGDQAAVSATVLAAVGLDDKAAEAAARRAGGKSLTDLLAGIGNQYDAVPATQEQASASGQAFVSPEDLTAPGPVVAMTPSDKTPELAARAAKDFQGFAEKSGLGDVDLANPPHNGGRVAQLAATVTKHNAAGTSDKPKDADNRKVVSTLFLMDTSGSMGLVEGEKTRMDRAQELAAAGLTDAGADGARVGLWNYSSPQSAGVTKGWRDNVPLGQNDDGHQSAQAVQALGFGGATWTYQAVLAALAHATEAYDDGGVNRIVLLTDGPDDSGATAEQFLSELQQAMDPKRPVQIDVVLLGDKIDAEVYEKLTAETGGELYSAQTSDSPEFAEAMQQAFAK